MLIVPVWFQFGSSLVLVWFQFGDGCVPVWFQLCLYVSSLVPVMFHVVAAWFQFCLYGSSLSPRCFQFGFDLVPVLVPDCFRFGSDLVPVLFICVQFGFIVVVQFGSSVFPVLVI